MHFHAFLIYCLLVAVISIEAQLINATYGEECGGLIRCDFRAYLTCNNGRCECVIPETMIFDGKTCALFAGENCSLSETETMPCVPNADCMPPLKSTTPRPNTRYRYRNKIETDTTESKNRLCKCKPDYFANQTGECQWKKSFNETCSNDNECHKDTRDFPFICDSEGRCACNSSSPIFNGRYCETPAGSQCNIYGADTYSCVANSICQNGYGGGAGVCVCSSNFFQTSLGTCEPKRGFGKFCNSNEQCDPDQKLRCGSNGECECTAPQYIYDAFQSKCALAAGSGCGDYRAACVTNSKCRPSSSSYSSSCQCDIARGAKNVKGLCLVSYGIDCGLGTTIQCNEEEQGTICTDGICECNKGIFDNLKEKCLTSVFDFCENTTDCISNSHCTDPEGEFNLRQCVCDNGFVSVDNACLPSIGMPCDLPRVNEKQRSGTLKGYCDPIASLRCINGTCKCKTEEEYDMEMRKCRGLVGSTCNPEDRNFCTTNAECILRWPYYIKTGKCGCKAGWQPNKDRKCVETLTASTISIELPQKLTYNPVSDM